MLELDVDNLRREVKKLRAELADLRAELAQVRQAKHDASRQGAEDPTEICTFRIVGVSQDCGPIDITVDMPSDCVPKSYATQQGRSEHAPSAGSRFRPAWSSSGRAAHARQGDEVVRRDCSPDRHGRGRRLESG